MEIYILENYINLNNMKRHVIIMMLVAMCLPQTIFAEGKSDSKQTVRTVTIDSSKKAQAVEGWGISLCWWARMCGQWDEAKIDTLIEWLVSPEGLNYNVFRYNIGGGDDPQNRNCEVHHMGNRKGKGLRAEMPGFKVSDDAPYDWQADSAQLKIMRKIKEKRPDAIFEAFSNSAPWYMTVSGCCGGSKSGDADNLRKDCYDAFAHYLVDVCKHIKDTYGIEFRTLEPFNESQSGFWTQGGSQEGCHFDVESQKAFIRVLYPILRASGLNTVISASDESHMDQSLNALTHYGSDIMKMVGQWNTHSYHGTNAERQQLRHLTDSLGLRLWQSETGSGGRGIDGNIKLLQRLFEDMKYLQPATWCDWQYVEDFNDQWCLVRGDFKTGIFHRVKNFYVRAQVTRFIKQGYTILSNDDDQTLSALSPDGQTLVLVAINDTAHPETIKYSIANGGTGAADVYTTDNDNDMKHTTCKFVNGQCNITMAPLSVKTIILGK